MKKIIFAILTFLCVCSLSCDDGDSKSSDNDGYLQEDMVIIKSHDYTSDGVIYNTENGKYRIMYNSSTKLMTQRTSCSGFSEGETGDLKGGTTIQIKFSKDQIDWSEKPYLVTPSEIWVYREECINPVEEEEEEEECNTCNPCNTNCVGNTNCVVCS